jgi:hypothetical protein
MRAYMYRQIGAEITGRLQRQEVNRRFPAHASYCYSLRYLKRYNRFSDELLLWQS